MAKKEHENKDKTNQDIINGLVSETNSMISSYQSEVERIEKEYFNKNDNSLDLNLFEKDTDRNIPQEGNEDSQTDDAIADDTKNDYDDNTNEKQKNNSSEPNFALIKSELNTMRAKINTNMIKIHNEGGNINEIGNALKKIDNTIYEIEKKEREKKEQEPTIDVTKKEGNIDNDNQIEDQIRGANNVLSGVNAGESMAKSKQNEVDEDGNLKYDQEYIELMIAEGEMLRNEANNQLALSYAGIKMDKYLVDVRAKEIPLAEKPEKEQNKEKENENENQDKQILDEEKYLEENKDEQNLEEQQYVKEERLEQTEDIKIAKEIIFASSEVQKEENKSIISDTEEKIKSLLTKIKERENKRNSVEAPKKLISAAEKTIEEISIPAQKQEEAPKNHSNKLNELRGIKTENTANEQTQKTEIEQEKTITLNPLLESNNEKSNEETLESNKIVHDFTQGIVNIGSTKDNSEEGNEEGAKKISHDFTQSITNQNNEDNSEINNKNATKVIEFDFAAAYAMKKQNQNSA